jgi:hypothetical protein
MFAAALAGAAAGQAVRLALGALNPLPLALLVAGVYGIVYFGVARLLGLAQARVVIDSLRRRLRL